jgi:signal transduction histidine kinase
MQYAILQKMNPISAFFVRNIILVFFFYGLAFFSMGLALALTSRRASEFKFAQAIRPLAAFGIAHGLHEWIEMFQKIATLTSGYTPTLLQEGIRLAVLVTSLLMLSAFGASLLGSGSIDRRRVYLFVAGMGGLWLLSVLVVTFALDLSAEQTVIHADVLARYSLGIPGALLGAWALMTQQRTFREHGMPQFGRDLVWCATALIMYGVVGQAFVRPTTLVPSNTINSTQFLQWFGIPIQLFRGVMATILAWFMVRALNAFELENQTRLQAANKARLDAQQAALEAERRVSREMERLNEELRLTTRELSLLLGLSNFLAAPLSLETRLQGVLERIVNSLSFPDAALTLLIRHKTGKLEARAAVGFDEETALYTTAQEIGQRCRDKAIAICQHADGSIIEFAFERTEGQEECRRYISPVRMIGLPLVAQERVIGSVVFCKSRHPAAPSADEFGLMAGIAQQLGLSIENARLYQEAQEREQLLGELLYQAVGAQEAERQRIARELHDATGQSLTAIALGLRGAEAILETSPETAATHIGALKSFTTDALGELRRLIADLRPSQLDDLGLVAALKWYCAEFEARYGIKTEFQFSGSRGRLTPEYETVLFRITQEALSNVAKHAQATQASIRLELDRTQVCLEVLDDGRGFDVAQALGGADKQAGWGLLGIQERTSLLGGEHRIESAPGKGTRISVSVPLLTEREDVQDTPLVG